MIDLRLNRDIDAKKPTKRFVVVVLLLLFFIFFGIPWVNFLQRNKMYWTVGRSQVGLVRVVFNE